MCTAVRELENQAMPTTKTIDISDAFLRVHNLVATMWKLAFGVFALLPFIYCIFFLSDIAGTIGWRPSPLVLMSSCVLVVVAGYLAFQALRPFAARLRIPFPRLLQPDVWETPYRVPGVDVVTMLARYHSSTRSLARWRYFLTPRRPVVAVTLGAAAFVTGGVVLIGLFELHNQFPALDNLLRSLSHLGRVGEVIAALIIGIPIVLGYLALSWFATDASRVVRAEIGTYLVLLRAFSRDEFFVRERVTRGLDVEEDETRIEDVVARSTKRVLPIVAIGDPKEFVPTLGANKSYFSDSTWRRELLEWLKHARGAAVLLGGSRHLTWEIEQIKLSGLAHHSMFVFPDRTITAEQLMQVAVAAGLEIVDACLSACSGGRRVLAVVPGCDAAHTIIVSKTNFTSDYELASRLCLALIVARSELVSETSLTYETFDEPITKSWQIHELMPRDHIRRAVAALTQEEKQRLVDVLLTKPTDVANGGPEKTGDQ